LGVGRKDDDHALQEKITVVKSKKVKNQAVQIWQTFSGRLWTKKGCCSNDDDSPQ
jgi:hypothetical protein